MASTRLPVSHANCHDTALATAPAPRSPRDVLDLVGDGTELAMHRASNGMGVNNMIMSSPAPTAEKATQSIEVDLDGVPAIARVPLTNRAVAGNCDRCVTSLPKLERSVMVMPT